MEIRKMIILIVVVLHFILTFSLLNSFVEEMVIYSRDSVNYLKYEQKY